MGSNETRSELIVATIYYLDAPVDAGFVEFFEKTVKAAVIGSGATVLAYFATEHSENTFPALPVREGENVFVWFARFNDPVAYERHIAALTVPALARRNFEGTRATPEARAGNLETLADDTLAFVRVRDISRAAKIAVISTRPARYSVRN